MQGISKQNGGIRSFFTVIDVFSKFAWAIPVYSKNASALTAAFGQLLKTVNKRHPQLLQTDKRKEFFNSGFKSLMKRHNIKHFANESEQKAAVIQRFNRIIKTRIWTYLSDRGTVRWLDVIQDLVNAYNHSRHRSIGMAPADVQKKYENRLWVRLFGDDNTHLKPQIPQGAMVQASSHKTIFDDGYMLNWTKENFTVSPEMPPRKGTKSHIDMFVDYNNDAVKGSLYPEKLQEILDNQYRIEKVLRKRTLPDGTKELVVRWEGWPKKYNS